MPFDALIERAWSYFLQSSLPLLQRTKSRSLSYSSELLPTWLYLIKISSFPAPCSHWVETTLKWLSNLRFILCSSNTKGGASAWHSSIRPQEMYEEHCTSLWVMTLSLKGVGRMRKYLHHSTSHGKWHHADVLPIIWRVVPVRGSVPLKSKEWNYAATYLILIGFNDMCGHIHIHVWIKWFNK